MASLNRVPEKMIGISPNTLEKELIYISTLPEKFIVNFDGITVGNIVLSRSPIKLGTITLG